uniref:hypothetical protein n=1 Tax=Thiolapillus sp. TaxID=2017437 RepID=UPI003AF6C5E2
LRHCLQKPGSFFLRLSNQGPYFTTIKEDGDDNLLAKPILLLCQIPFNLAVTAIAEAILMNISAQQVPS